MNVVNRSVTPTTQPPGKARLAVEGIAASACRTRLAALGAIVVWRVF